MGVLKRVSETDFTPVSAERKLCLNIRWKKMCNACADVCPTSAMDCEKLHVDAAKCVACGVCALVCPAGALTFSPRTRPSILSEIIEVLGKSTVVMFSCDRCGGAFGKAEKAIGSIVVPCLSMLDEELILECYDHGATDVKLTGCSPQCKFGRGREIYKQTQKLANELRRTLEPLSGADNTNVKGTAGDIVPATSASDRREFIIRSGRELVRAAYASDHQNKKDGRWSWLHRLPARRADLIKIAERSRAKRHEIARYDGMPFAVVAAERKRCSMCGACGALCPTGAIGTVELESLALLYFRFGWCTACLLCVRACPERALTVDETVDIGMVAEPGKPILKFATAHCSECQNIHIPERTGEECPVCKKQNEIPRPGRKVPRR